jgi:hypothetical protein
MKPSLIARINLDSEPWVSGDVSIYQSVSALILPIVIDESGLILNDHQLQRCWHSPFQAFSFIPELCFSRQPGPAATRSLIDRLHALLAPLSQFALEDRRVYVVNSDNTPKNTLSPYRLRQILRSVRAGEKDPLLLSYSDDNLSVDGVIEISSSALHCREVDRKLDYDSYRHLAHFRPNPDCNYFIPSCCSVSGVKSDIFFNYSPQSYLDWIQISSTWSLLFHSPAKFSAVFIEDVESHANILPECNISFHEPVLHCEGNDSRHQPAASKGMPVAGNTALAIHAFYPENLPAIISILDANKSSIDFYVSTTDEKCDEVANVLEHCGIERFQIFVCPNQGRDIAPFMNALLPAIIHGGHDHFVKIHTKKSPHLDAGNDWASHLISSLVSESGLQFIRETFSQPRPVGLLSPPGSVIPISACLNLNAIWLQKLLETINVSGQSAVKKVFIAGSMFAGKVNAFKPLMNSLPTLASYEPEQGQVDATLAHAIERFLSIYIQHHDYLIEEIPGDTSTAPAFGYLESQPVPGKAATLNQKLASLPL